MTVTNPEPVPAVQPDKPVEPDTDKPLGANGEKALEAERDARKQLEKELKELKAAQADLPNKLAEVFGIKSEGAKPEDAVATLQQQFGKLQHDNLVLTIAAAHQITDKDDLEHLRLAADEAAMTKLAARLKPADKEPEAQRRPPRPDPSQGKGVTDVKPGEAGKAEAARRGYIKTQQ
jgi:peptidoglycan hydrolase CwlO-like protein